MFKPNFKSHNDFPKDFNDLPEKERRRISDERTRLLHIHAQLQWHSPVQIVGNKNSLSVLIDALQEALRKGKSSTHAMTTDGEGYTVMIELDDHKWEHKAWTTRGMPYTDPVACGERDPDWDITKLKQALRKANEELVKRGVRPIPEPE